MIATNNTNFTSDEAFKIIYKSVSKEALKRLLLPLIIFLCSIPILVIGFILNQPSSVALGFVFLGISLIYLIYSLIKYKKLPGVIKKNTEEICNYGARYTYKFKEQSVDVMVNITGKAKTVNMKYQNLKRIIEFKDYYELMFGEEDSIFVLKSGFENEKMEEVFRHNITLNKRKIISKK